MSGASQNELGLTIPLQRHLRIKVLPYGQEPDRRFCWAIDETLLAWIDEAYSFSKIKR